MSILEIDENDFTGDVSTWNWAPLSLGAFEMGGNRFTGVFDLGALTAVQVTRLGLQNNDLDGISNFQRFPRMRTLEVEGNKLNFDDLEIVDSIPGRFTYSLQDSIGETQKISASSGDDVMLLCPAGGTITEYQWPKDGVEISGANDASLSIQDISTGDMGVYSCAATHDSFPDLTLNMRPTRIDVITSTKNFESQDWDVYPSPAVNVITVQSPRNWDNPKVEIVTATGLRILPNYVLLDKEIILDINDLRVGAYVLIITEGSDRVSGLFLKK